MNLYQAQTAIKNKIQHLKKQENQFENQGAQGSAADLRTRIEDHDLFINILERLDSLDTTPPADIISGFPYAEPNCKGCNQPLTVENAWMADGCPCNSPLGINSMNETRWRLLMQLQQEQARRIAH